MYIYIYTHTHTAAVFNQYIYIYAHVRFRGPQTVNLLQEMQTVQEQGPEEHNFDEIMRPPEERWINAGSLGFGI